MVRAESMLTDGIAMRLRGIAFILLPLILRKILGQLYHAIITIGLGQDRGCGDRHQLAVALDDSSIRKAAPRLEAVAIDDDGLRHY